MKPGDVVRLNSGGPDMTVYKLRPNDDSIAICLWFDDNKQSFNQPFPVVCLTTISRRAISSQTTTPPSTPAESACHSHPDTA